jgi:hypothetical protein
MDKTLLRKLTANQSGNYAPPVKTENEGIFGVLRHEKRILDALAKDLLQPRPEAVSKILELAGKM